MRRFLAPLLLSLSLAAPALAHEDGHHDGVMVEHPWARTTGTMTRAGAVYMTVKNGSHEMVTLTGVATERAKVAEIHQSSEEGGVMKMRMVESLPIAPGETIEFAPGGYHVMLIGLTEPLKEGDVFPITLTFDKAGSVPVIVTVTGMDGKKDDHAGHH